MAIERGYEYYFWGHSDVAVLARDESASFADDVIACVESSFRSRPNWGIIYFNYDWFSAIRTDLVRQVSAEGLVMSKSPQYSWSQACSHYYGSQGMLGIEQPEVLLYMCTIEHSRQAQACFCFFRGHAHWWVLACTKMSEKPLKLHR